MLTRDMEQDWMESRGLGVHKCHLIEKLEPYMNEGGIYDIQKHQSEACRLPLAPDYKDAANPATVVRLLDVINTLAIWLSYSNDCPMPDCHPCEYRSGSGCDADTNKAKFCWIQAAKEVTNDDPRTNR